MKLRNTNATIMGTIVLAAFAKAQDDFSKVEIRTIPVAGNIYMLEGRGGNIGVSVGTDGVLIVDDQFAPLAEKIRDALRKLGGDKPRFVLNTHWHGDHVGGNEAFGRDGTIIAHDNVRERLAVKQELFGKEVAPLPKEGLPVVTFGHTLTLHFNDEAIRVRHVPRAHTDGDSIVYFTKSNVVHMGDCLFAGMFPFVDLDHGGDVEGLAKNVAEVIAQLPADVKVIPGHGPLSTLEDLKTFNLMLSDSLTLVKKSVAEGKTLEQIKAAGVHEKWKSWGEGFIKTDRWLETVHKSVTRK
jgi:glyoxylase-like metal-dependent hydrolase (beta-lactamase superfamily II)